MSLYVPVGYKIPTNVATLEMGIVHGVLVASTLYRGQQIIEDDNVARAVCTYSLFNDPTQPPGLALRIGFRGSFRLNPNYPLANQQNKAFWEYVEEHANVSLPTAYYQEI